MPIAKSACPSIKLPYLPRALPVHGLYGRMTPRDVLWRAAYKFHQEEAGALMRWTAVPLLGMQCFGAVSAAH